MLFLYILWNVLIVNTVKMSRYHLFDLLRILLLTLFTVHLSQSASLDIQGNYQRFTGDQGLYTQKDDIEILTSANFKDAIVGSKRAWLVEFYNSWCGFCQKFAPSWKEFATDVKGWRDLVVVAAMDCANDQNYVTCRDLEVMSYPTIRYYHEGFEEKPKDFGDAMNRGVTAKDHRQDLLDKIIKEQEVGRGKQYPDILPYTSASVNDIFDKAPAGIKYAVLVVHEPGSLLGAEITFDLHKTSSLIVRYTHSNNTALVQSLPSGPVPNIFVISPDKHIMTVMPKSQDRYGFIEAIKENLRDKNIVFAIDQDARVGTEKQEQQKDSDSLLEKAKKLGDVVFQMDLETVLRYSLKREVGGVKEITGEKLLALRKYLEVLAKYFPFGQNGKSLLQDISAYAESNDPVEGRKIASMVKEAEGEDKQVFSTPQKWLGCQGSSPQYRGYPCGLWKLFHYLTINVAEYDPELRGDNPRLALEAMHGYIKNFFGCSDCSQHFQEMAARRELDKVDSFDDSILWLWQAHNEVNKRLSGDLTEDPQNPKIQFPSQKNCWTCYKPDGSWDNNVVLRYLKVMYSSVNIKYLGADTKVIYLAHGGINSSAHEGLPQEDVQIQARSIGKGVANATGQFETASGATTKDKANLIMIFVFSIVITFLDG